MKWLALIILFSQSAHATSAVAYAMNGGRFGDKLIAFCHARWLAYKYDIPLSYKPFEHSDQLSLSINHKHLSKKMYSEIVHFPRYGEKIEDLGIEREANKFYVIPYFPECRYDAIRQHRIHFDVDWKDPGFKKALREDFRSLVPLNTIELPKDRLTVAVHIRTGGGFDSAMQRRRFPLKFPPESFFVEYLKKISELFEDAPLYVHVFTDDEATKELLTSLEKEVNKPNITYGCREKDNHYTLNILDDFFALLQFDCLIRGESNFSLIASKLADYKVLVYPLEFEKLNNKVVIAKACVEPEVLF